LDLADEVDPVAASTLVACRVAVAVAVAADAAVAAVWDKAGADRMDATGAADGVRSTASTPALETGGALRRHSKDRWP
jgi:hypothetical protein